MNQNKKHTNYSFFLDFFFNNKSFPFFYRKITNTITNTIVYEADAKTNNNFNNSIISVTDIPSYFTPQYASKNKRLKLLKTPLYSGFLINLSKFKNLEDYLDNKLGKPRKSQLKRYRKRLDKCITPNYKIFYGDISKDEYNFIFNKLIVLTKRRFAQKEELNFELPFLELYHSIMYPLVLSKKASIFVIYDNDKPINITLNFLDKECIFHWNSCYDIDYQMFNLGHINMINHLEWAFKNGYKVFDMSRGDFLHKRKYVNQSYLYNEHIIYNSKSISATIKAYFKLLKLKTRYALIKFLKKINLHLWYGKYAKYKFRRLNSENTKDKHRTIITNDVSKIPKPENLKLIDLNKSEYYFLIKPFNYLLHKTQDHIKNISVYSDLKESNIFYFKSTNKQQKITIKN